MRKLIKNLVFTLFFLLALTCSFMLFAVENRTELTTLPIYIMCLVVMTITFYGIIKPTKQ